MSMFICEYDWQSPRIEWESCRDRSVRKQAGSDWVRYTAETMSIRRKFFGRKVQK
jgi:hypothetical protein